MHCGQLRARKPSELCSLVLGSLVPALSCIRGLARLLLGISQPAAVVPQQVAADVWGLLRNTIPARVFKLSRTTTSHSILTVMACGPVMRMQEQSANPGVGNPERSWAASHHLQADQEGQSSSHHEEEGGGKEAEHAELDGQHVWEHQLEGVRQARCGDEPSQGVQVGRAQHTIGFQDGEDEKCWREVLAERVLGLQAGDMRLRATFSTPPSK